MREIAANTNIRNTQHTHKKKRKDLNNRIGFASIFSESVYCCSDSQFF